MILAHKGFLVLPELPVQLVPPARIQLFPAQRARKVSKVILEQQVQLARQVRQEHKVRQARQDQLRQYQGRRGHRVRKVTHKHLLQQFR